MIVILFRNRWCYFYYGWDNSGGWLRCFYFSINWTYQGNGWKSNIKKIDDCQVFCAESERQLCKKICRWHIFSTKREKMFHIFGLVDRTNPLGWRIPPEKKKPWKTRHLAEAEGFEPSCRITPTTAFRVRLITTALIRFQHEHYTTLIGFFQLIIEIVLIFIGKILSFFLLKLYVKCDIIFL